ncbi:DUF4388 domain-containing protein [Malonomonas rubra]|uniref:DUF4388 domain-containing protein n=1 Tax=Malonomonas rubra TaxID=57040 RepID=UPI0026F2909E|nr:DUF4388 domain-containing protein [Malonomonas rubra]
MTELKINSDGQLKLPLALRHQLRDAPLKALSNSAGHLLLGRAETTTPILLAGVLGELSIPDLLSFFNMFRKTGILHFDLKNGSKSLYFQKGEIVFATSTFASEELGELLFSLGKVEREALQQLRKQARGRKSLGKLLVERGQVAPSDLWRAVRSQIEGIVYNLFAEQQGGFHFESRALDQEQILRLSMSTQNLIMEGLRRQDEEALFMRRIISLEYYPTLTGMIADAVNLPQSEVRLLKLVEVEVMTAQEVFRKAGMSTFDGLRNLYSLLEKGLLQMAETPVSEIGGELGQILIAYNNLLKVLCQRMLKDDIAFLQRISQFLAELQQPFSFVLRDVELLEDGTLDGHTIVENLNGLEEGDKRKLLADSLCELVFMITTVVRGELDGEDARPLVARVQEVTTRVRELVERD